MAAPLIGQLYGQGGWVDREEERRRREGEQEGGAVLD